MQSEIECVQRGANLGMELSTNRKNRVLRAPDLSLPPDDKDFRQAIGGNFTGSAATATMDDCTEGSQSIPKTSASQSLRCAVDEVRRPAMHDVAQLATGGLLGAPFHRALIISDHVAKTGPLAPESRGFVDQRRAEYRFEAAHQPPGAP